MNPEDTVSAQVVLAAASGAHPRPDTRITSDNIHEWTPSAETILRVSDALRDMGFEVGDCVGNSCAITGAARLFELRFGATLGDAAGGVQFADHGYELEVAQIPSVLRPQVVAITFTPPPDFGPGAASSFG